MPDIVPGIVPGTRLDTAIKMLSGCRVLADIGCDHGRLCCAMLQQDASLTCIGADISAPSLDKAKALAEKTGLLDRLSLRVGDGLSVLQPFESDAIAILGMGGTLQARILEAATVPLMGAKRCVLQPMRAQDDVRCWLYENGYRIGEDTVVREAGRLYQLFTVLPPNGTPDPWPEGFPKGCFTVGYRAYEKRDPLTREFVLRELKQAQKRLKTAAGTRGEDILRLKEKNMLTILDHWEASDEA